MLLILAGALGLFLCLMARIVMLLFRVPSEGWIFVPTAFCIVQLVAGIGVAWRVEWARRLELSLFLLQLTMGVALAVAMLTAGGGPDGFLFILILLFLYFLAAYLRSPEGKAAFTNTRLPRVGAVLAALAALGGFALVGFGAAPGVAITKLGLIERVETSEVNAGGKVVTVDQLVTKRQQELFGATGPLHWEVWTVAKPTPAVKVGASVRGSVQTLSWTINVTDPEPLPDALTKKKLQAVSKL